MAQSKQASQTGGKSSATTSRTPTNATSQNKAGAGTSKPSITSAPKAVSTQQELDISGLNLGKKDAPQTEEPPPKASMSRDKLLEEVRKALDAQDKEQRKALSLVVIGGSSSLA